jgi:hypothetical protein
MMRSFGPKASSSPSSPPAPSTVPCTLASAVLSAGLAAVFIVAGVGKAVVSVVVARTRVMALDDDVALSG